METNEPHEWEGLSQVCGGSIGCRTGLKTLCLWWVLIQSQGLITSVNATWLNKTSKATPQWYAIQDMGCC